MTKLSQTSWTVLDGLDSAVGHSTIVVDNNSFSARRQAQSA
jgi:hypothetical protein